MKLKWRWQKLKIEQLGVLTTVVIAFAALAALVLTGQSGIRQDLRALRIEMLAGQAELRNDMLAGQAGLRKDLRAVEAGLRKDLRAVEAGLRKDLQAVEAGLRKDLRAVEAGLRQEIKAGQAGLRQEIKAGQAGLRQEIKAGQAELRAGQTEIRKEMRSLDVRLAVVEQRTAGLSGESGASTAEPAPAAVPGARHRSARASLLLARAVTAAFGSLAAGGTIH